MRNLVHLLVIGLLFAYSVAVTLWGRNARDDLRRVSSENQDLQDRITEMLDRPEMDR